MKARIAHASFWAMAGSALQYAMLFALLAYLTRILSPRDFGLMATVSIGLDLGLRIARWGQIELLQQPAYRTDAARNHALRLSIVIASVVAVLIVALAWPLSRYYGPELVTMSLIAAPVILINAASTTAEAVLRNDFRYNQITIRNTVSTVIGGSVAIAFAINGYGAVSLAIQQLVQAGVAGIWTWLAIDWRPTLTRSSFYSETAAQHGAGIMIGSLLPQLVPRTFDLVVAAALGPVQLGILRVANRFNDFIGQMIWVPLSGVASTELAHAAPDVAAMRWTYLRFVQASAALACPLAIGVGIVAHEAVPLLFGPTWAPSIPLVQISSLLAFTLPVSSYFVSTMIALGKRHVIIRQGLLDLAVSIALLALVADQPLPLSPVPMSCGAPSPRRATSSTCAVICICRCVISPPRWHRRLSQPV